LKGKVGTGWDWKEREERYGSVVESKNFLKILLTQRAKSAVYDCLVPFDDKAWKPESRYAKIINYSALS